MSRLIGRSPERVGARYRAATGGRAHGRVLAVVALVVSSLGWAGPVTASPSPAGGGDTPIAVRYRSRGHVYLDQGSAAGLRLGQRMVALRDGARVADLEIIHVSAHSATARVLQSTRPIAASDVVVRPSQVPEVLRQMRQELRSHVDSTQLNRLSSLDQPPTAVANRAVGGGRVGILRPGVPTSVSTSRSKAHTGFAVRERKSSLWDRSSGTISVLWEGFQDGKTAPLNVNDVTGRASLSLRDIGGQPYDVRVRMRLRQINRSRSGQPSVPESETRNRLYEVSLRYDPPDGRLTYVLGRVGVSPFVGAGYIDGVMARYKLSDTLQIGAFGGAVPTVDGIRFGFDASRYGAFAHFGTAIKDKPQHVDLLISGIRERLDSRNRDYLSFETSYSAPRWTLFQRAEFDFTLPSRDGTSSGSGLSSASFGATYQLATRSRIYASVYTRRDTLPGVVRLDSNAFEDRFRSSVRAGVSLGVSRSLSFNFGGGVRFEQGASSETLSGNFGVLVRMGKLWTSASLLGYSGPRDDGYVGTLRATAVLSRSARINGYYSRYLSRDSDLGVTRTDNRFGANLWVDLQGGLFMQGGFESSSGRDLEGTRAIAEAGIRF